MNIAKLMASLLIGLCTLPAELSDFLYESVLYQFSDELGDCRYADADLAADLRDAVRPFIYEFAEYGLLYGRALAFGVVEK